MLKKKRTGESARRVSSYKRHIRSRDDTLRGLVLRHKGHTIERPLNLLCSLEIKGPAVVGTAPMAQGPELRRSTRRAAQGGRVRL